MTGTVNPTEKAKGKFPRAPLTSVDTGEVVAGSEDGASTSYESGGEEEVDQTQSFLSRQSIEQGYRWWYMLPAMALQSVTWGLTIGVMPELTLKFFGPNVMTINGIFEAAVGIVSFVASPLLGALSDRYGRGKIMSLCYLLSGAQYFALLFTTNLWYYMGLRPLAGISYSGLALAYAYIADCTMPEERPRVFGLTSVTFFSSMVVSTICGGWIASHVPVYYLWVVICSSTIINFLYIYTVIPSFVVPLQTQVSDSTETLTGENADEKPLLEESKKRIFTRENMNPFNSLRPVFTNPSVMKLGIAMFFFQILFNGYIHNIMLFTTQYMHFTAYERSLQMTLSGVFGALSGFLIRPVTSILGQKATLAVAMGGYGVTIALLGVWTTKGVLYGGMVAHIITSMVNPLASAMVSALVPPNMQGSVQGALTGLKSLGEVFAPISFGALINWFDRHATHQAGHALVIGSFFVVPSVIAVCMLPAPERVKVKVVAGVDTAQALQDEEKVVV
eukprot:comp24264_c3_seq1/m.45156 comp24264_c3_seq1/g.45156  ORF comp24264_c3_seq1/g.45156 comp24264_c3_seq1/m.45156 type:complete len:504 (-) comp24264_c3_seq1:536-2047(-)